MRGGIGHNGCCGDGELIKLFAYTLDETIAVHMDLDTLVVHPLDELFDVMYFDGAGDEGRSARSALLRDGIVAPTYLNRRMTGDPTGATGVGNATKRRHASAKEVMADIVVDAFFTKDYNMIRPGAQQRRVGVTHICIPGQRLYCNYLLVGTVQACPGTHQINGLPFCESNKIAS